MTMLHAGFGTRLAWIASAISCRPDRRDDEDAPAAASSPRGRDRTLAAIWQGHDELACGASRGGKIERLRARTCGSPRRGPLAQVLDVRERAEWDAGHIPGSMHPPPDLREIPEGVDPGRPVP